jgi:hypothetical protein
MVLNLFRWQNYTCKTILVTLALLLYLSHCINAQDVKLEMSTILDKKVAIDFDHVRIADVLKTIGTKGNFYFSYSGRIVPTDSLVSIKAADQSVLSILRALFRDRYEYEQQSNYLIISAALPHLSLINTDITSDNYTYSISGIVVDERNGERLMNASIYNKQELAATLSDEHGYFKLKFRVRNPEALRITASKIAYRDVSMNFLQPIAIINRAKASSYQQYDGSGVENDRLGRLFISARQRIQSLNIPDFFATRAFQVSIAPGLSTHGLFSSQVVNKVSINLAGGYTAGVNGFEAGGLFNINKGNSRYLQLAGVFNLVGGNFTGIQLAGVTNRALDTVKGVQVAGFINKSEGPVSGVQVGALTNEAHQLKGVQIGLVNVADTSSGFSIGLINIIRNGFYKVGVSTNNLTNTNMTFSTGTHRFYTTLILGSNISINSRMHVFGAGIGHDFILTDKLCVSANASIMLPYTGTSVDDRWKQAKLLLNLQLSKNISINAGPSFNNYTTATPAKSNYRTAIRSRFAGWEAGIAYNSVFKPVLKSENESAAWYLGAAALAGRGWDWPDGAIYGAEVFGQRDLSGRMAATLSIGYLYNEVDKVETMHYGYPDGSLVQVVTQDFKALPVKAGMRSYAGKRLFFSGELGAVFGINQPSKQITTIKDQPTIVTDFGNRKSLIYAVSAGYSFYSGLEAGLKFEDYNQVRFKQFLLRLGYRFKIGR